MYDSYWGWFLWFAIFFFFFSSFGNWGYTYRAHRRFDRNAAGRTAIEIVNERYASGDITQEVYRRMRADLLDSASELPASA